MGCDWDYFCEDDLRTFLKARAAEGYSFPLNPVWLVRDHGWYEVWKQLQAGEDTSKVNAAWYPPDSGICDIIDQLHESHPEGFSRDISTKGRKSSIFNDLSGREKADLALE